MSLLHAKPRSCRNMITTALKNLLPSALLLAVAATPAAATVTWEFVETSVDNGVPPPVPFSPHIAGTLSMSDTDFLNGGIFYSATFTINVVNGLCFNGAFAIEYERASAWL